MSGAIDNGGAAFPVYPRIQGSESREIVDAVGMTLRDYFAVKAMAALIIDPARADQSREECARLSYLMADAMIQARKAVTP